MKTEANNKFDKSPLLKERIACGINALIDFKNIPTEKVLKGDLDKIGNKLALMCGQEELSSDAELTIQIQSLIASKCYYEKEFTSLMLLWEAKFLHFTRTGYFI